MLVKTDYTLRRFQNAEDVESDAPSKMPRSYRLEDIEFIAKDAAPRFYLQLKSNSIGGAGEQVKLSAETDSERLEWMNAIVKLKEAIPKEEDDDPYREGRRTGTGSGSGRGGTLPTRARRDGRVRRNGSGGICAAV